MCCHRPSMDQQTLKREEQESKTTQEMSNFTMEFQVPRMLQGTPNQPTTVYIDMIPTLQGHQFAWVKICFLYRKLDHNLNSLWCIRWFLLLIAGCLVLSNHTLNPFAYTHRRVGWWVVREGGSSGYNLPQAKLTSWVSGLMKVSQVIHSHL